MAERVLSQSVELDVDKCLNVYGSSPCAAGRYFTPPTLDLDFTGTEPSLVPTVGPATFATTRAGTATRWKSVPRYLLVPGLPGDFAFAPDSPDNRVTGDLGMRWCGALGTYLRAGLNQTLGGKYDTGVGRSYCLQVNLLGGLRLTTSPDGAATNVRDSTVTLASVGITAAMKIYLGVYFDADNGLAGSTVTFYWSLDGVTWNVLGAPVVTAGVDSIYAGPAPMTIGAFQSTGVGDMAPGKVYSFEVRRGWSGQVVSRFDASDWLPTDSSRTTALTNEVWTIAGNAAVVGTEIETVAVNAARFDFDPITLTCNGLLDEVSRTNEVLNSDDFTTGSWTLSAATLISAALHGPDGNVVMQKLTETAVNAEHFVDQANLAGEPDNTIVADSVYAGAAERTWLFLGIVQRDAVTVKGCYFDLVNGVVGTASAGITGYIFPVRKNVWRCGIVGSVGAGASNPHIRVQAATGDASALVYNGVAGNGIYIWRAQSEPGSCVTSGIPTAGAPVTRNVDRSLCTDISAIFNPTQGALFAEAKMLPGSRVAAVQQCIASFNDGTANESVEMRVGGAGNTSMFVVDGGVNQAAIPAVLQADNAVFRIAGSYALNNFNATLNGAAIVNDAAGTLPTVTQMTLGHNGAGQDFNGWIRRVTYWQLPGSTNLLTLSAAGVINASAPCYNTFRTCQDKPGYRKGTQTISFTLRGAPIPLGVQARPYIEKVSRAETKIDPEQGLAVRSAMSVTLVDELDSDVQLDPYLRTRTQPAPAGGTFWTRFLARNLNTVGRTARVKQRFVDHGVPGASIVERFIVDGLKGPAKDGRITLTLKDPTKLLDKTKAPTPTSGKLAVDLQLTDSQLVLGAGQGAQYAATGYVRIGDEVIKYDGNAGDVLSWSSPAFRAVFGTEAGTPSAGAVVQQCLVYTNASISSVLEDLYNRAGIPDADIDLAGLQLEDATWLGTQYLVTTAITDPQSISTLVQEILQQAYMMAWWSPTLQQHKFKVFAPSSPAAVVSRTLDDTGYLIDESVEIERLDALRITMCAVYFGRSSAIANVTEAKNYGNAELTIDADAESPNEYGTRTTQTVYSRWFGVNNTLAMRALAQRMVGRRRDPPENMKSFNLDPKDGDIAEGQLVDVKNEGFVNADGSPRTARVLITSRNDQGTHLEYTARVTTFDRRYGFIAPNGTPDYPNNNGYACVSLSNGLMHDGSNAYLVI